MRWLLDYFAQTDVRDLNGLVREALEEEIEEDDEAFSSERRRILGDVHGRLSASIRSAPKSTIRSIIRRVLPYAAAVLVLISVGIYWFGTRGDSHLVSRYGGDVQPGTNRATLAFADGRAVDLSEAQQGIIVGEAVTYLDGSEVRGYGTANRRSLSADQQLITPKGGTYSVTLSDGTRVWLNAASTLKYPARFSDKERVVTLEGEAYFEVQPVSKTPFKVISNGQTVEVLGTAFGISAYPDEEETKTTLVEGAVRLRPDAGGAVVSLVPGEQGVLVAGSIAKQEVNVSTHTAWKDGLIVLKGASISTVIKQIERWYDVEFVDAAGLDLSGPLALSGELPRGIRLSEILEALEMYVDATFKIEGRRVFVKG